MTDKVRRRSEMVISTSSLPPDDDAYEVIGVFHGETVAGVNFIRDSFAGIRDIIGGRSETYEKAVREARSAAIDEMRLQAAGHGADAIIGYRVQIETIGQMMMVHCYGTGLRRVPADAA